MARLHLALAARVDIAGVLAWSEQNFGAAARLRYERLISVALADVAADPTGLGASIRPELGDSVFSRHLRASREHAREPGGAVKRPRHFLIYRVPAADLVVVGRLLHDAMELSRHLPPGVWE
jgi:toxin ParE1/3/4